MHIALIVERFAPGGGVEGAAWHLAHGLAAEGTRLQVFCRRADPTATVETVRVRVPEGWQPLRVWCFARDASNAAAASGASLVHSFARTHRQHLYRAGGGRHADYVAATYSPLGRALRIFSPRHRVLLALERRIFRDVTQRIQCNSKWVRDALITRAGIDPERLVVTYNGVDLERFSPARDASERSSLRKREGRGDEPTWLFAGSGFRRKGLDTALRALGRPEAREVELWVAGGDPPRPWRRLAERLGVAKRVHFLGRRDLAPLLRAADGLVLPTRYDAFANVCLEAAACGCPVLTSANNGAAEILGAGGHIVSDPESADAFGAALGTPPQRLRAMGHAARDIAMGFSWARYVAAQRDLYREMGAS